MGYRNLLPVCLLLSCLALPAWAQEGVSSEPPSSPVQVELPGDFVFLEALIPGLVVDLRYQGADNFLGQPVDGYQGARPMLTRAAAEALARVQQDLAPFGLGLKVFDAYRPQRAVDHFVRWARDLQDVRMQARYYPRVDKSRLFVEGYIADRSGHSRGSTVDLTLVELSPEGVPGRELDMGSGFDFFGPESWPTSGVPDAGQRAHRALLQALMLRHGFKPYDQEWWHFTLAREPYPDRYFDFLPRP